MYLSNAYDLTCSFQCSARYESWSWELLLRRNVIVPSRFQGLPSLPIGEVTVNIQVEDFNDCPPMFTNPPTSLSLLENATSGTVLNTFVVRDCDSGLNGPNGTRFSIIAGKYNKACDVKVREMTVTNNDMLLLLVITACYY